MRHSLAAICLLLAIGCSQEQVAGVQADANPNIIVILADDMGYGDVRAYNGDSRIPTPNLDELATDGIRFTDAHSASAVCSSARYAFLTGRYSWRSRLKAGVLRSHSPALIETDRETISSLLSRRGYHTAAIGKWHLGFGTGRRASDASERFSPGPNELGFDYFFGLRASPDYGPYLYIENGRPYTPLTGKVIEASGQRRYGGGGFWRKGRIAEGFVHREVLPTLTDKAIAYINERESEDDRPFFLYFALTAPHQPWLPTEEFIGKSEAGYYGDFVAQIDAVVGQIRDAVQAAGEDDNTLLIFTSDNGAHWLDSDIAEFGHLANGALRGQKADIHEGGHRVPFIARWAGRIPAGSISTHPTVLTDLMATFASITGTQLAIGAGPDSFDCLQSLLGNADEQAPRAAMVHHAFDGMLAIREGEWKLIEGLGSGGFTKPVRETPEEGQPAVQLYNLSDDPTESHNVAAENPETVERLLAMLNRFRNDGRSRQENRSLPVALKVEPASRSGS